MNFDVEKHLAANDRSVSFIERDGKPASAVNISRTFDASISELWGAVTDADNLPLWFTNVTGDLQLNGRYHVEGNASGTITDCKPQSHVTLTWEIFGDISWVELRFDSEASDLTRFTLTHTSYISEHWNTYGPGATGVGWEMAYLGLALYLADPHHYEKPDETEFAYSPDGKAFITGSSNAWAQAAIDTGTVPETARQAARQTTAFYTGQELDEA